VSLIILNAEETAALLPMSECVDVMEEAMAATSSGSMLIPPRLIFNLIDNTGFFGAMPGSSSEMPFFGAKIVSFLPGNPAKGMPAVGGFVTLFDRETGEPRALVAGGVITDIRTAAASAMAARHLARADARSCGIFGTGGQAKVHIEAMCAVRPVEDVVIWGRDPAKAEALALKHAHLEGIVVRATDDPAEAGACDLVCTTTVAKEPILKGEWVQPGAHISLVGAHALGTREADTELVVKSKVYVDSLESTLNEGGDIMTPVQEGAIDESHIWGEIGQLLGGEIQGRNSDDEITLYNSLGVVSQDLYAARYVLQQAQAKGLGTEVAF
jgi:ornithine cyclodeaminase